MSHYNPLFFPRPIDGGPGGGDPGEDIRQLQSQVYELEEEVCPPHEHAHSEADRWLAPRCCHESRLFAQWSFFQTYLML